MFDLNTVLSAAIAAAVQQTIQPLQQEYANKMAEMAEKIAKLEMQSADRHERLRVLEGALTDRVAALETLVAIGVDTTLAARVDALEQATPVGREISAAAFVTHLDNQEWFWEKLLRKAGEAAQSVAAEAISDHCADHDHDSYDNAVSELEDLDMDDFVRSADIEEAVNDALDSVTFTVRINR